MNTYTEHNLTSPQCKRLNQLINGKLRLHGMALVALVRKGLVHEAQFDIGEYHPKYVYTLSDTGREAYRQARREGW